jgi:hypothetical protein
MRNAGVISGKIGPTHSIVDENFEAMREFNDEFVRSLHSDIHNLGVDRRTIADNREAQNTINKRMDTEATDIWNKVNKEDFRKLEVSVQKTLLQGFLTYAPVSKKIEISSLISKLTEPQNRHGYTG